MTYLLGIRKKKKKRKKSNKIDQKALCTKQWIINEIKFYSHEVEFLNEENEN